MNIAILIAAAAVVWIAHALVLARLMSSRGFHPLPWIAVSFLLGPAIWPLALIEIASGVPGPTRIRRGHHGGGELDVFVAFDRDVIDERSSTQLARLAPRCDHLVLARVIKAGGPTFIPGDAEAFLCDTASRLGASNAELQLHQGCFGRIVRRIRAQGDFDLVLRSDEPSELFEEDGSRPEMRCLRDVTAA